uniref:Endonuclease/exonuclease/phosphatase domain-containing protein n=1 Tax=Manihot esculenta TaxID=3983 RepID=A0A2C9WK16_MANES
MGIWRLTRYYSYAGWNRRRESWNLLRSLHPKSPLPWIVVSDFNDLIFNSEKDSLTAHLQWLLYGFGQTLEACGLHDLGFAGSKYTWMGKQEDILVKERLDRVVGTLFWTELFSQATVYVLEALYSDHKPLLVSLEITVV